MSSAGHKKLSLTDMSSAFVIYGLGLSLGVLVFLIELIFDRIKLHRRSAAVTEDKRQKVITSIVAVLAESSQDTINNLIDTDFTIETTVKSSDEYDEASMDEDTNKTVTAVTIEALLAFSKDQIEQDNISDVIELK